MANLLGTQYALVQQSRQVVFQFLEANIKDNIATPLPVFKDKAISYMYVHIANTYIAWAGNFALNGSFNYYDQDAPLNTAQIKQLFEQVDEIMEHFIAHFSSNPTHAIKGYKWPEKYIETDVFGIFMSSLMNFTIKVRR